MEIINALKTIYEKSDDKIMFTDKSLVVLWRNHDELPEMLIPENIRLSDNTAITLPVAETTVCRYSDGVVEYTLRINPMYENGVTAGYLISLLDEYDVDKLAMQSMLKERIKNDLESVRFEASRLIALLNFHRKAWSKVGNEDYSDFDDQSRQMVLRIMSSISNYEEASIYLGDNIKAEYMFMSAVLGDLAERIHSRAEKAGYIFECDVHSMVNVPMNKDRFEAVVANLVANAYMYNSKPEKKCSIELSANGSRIVLTVTDNGDGIPEDKLAKLQRPFEYFSFDDMHESLGLTVAMLYCQRFGGSLEIESVVGKYTKVKMIFEDPGKSVPHAFRQYKDPKAYSLDNTGCILGKCFGYYDEDIY